MDSEFSAAMRRATECVREQDLTGATATIQAALRGGRGDRRDASPSAATVAATPAGADAAEGRHAPEPGGDAVAPAAARPFVPRIAPLHRRLKMPLGDVVRTLRAGRRRTDFDALPGDWTRAAGTAPELRVPDGAQFLARAFSSPVGGREYRLYVPACEPAEIEGLLLMLHGCRQTPDDFAVGTNMNAVAESRRLVVVYPAQPNRANVSGCWNWFDPAHQLRGAGEPAILAGLTQAVAAEFGVRKDRIFVAGLSAGGAMAAVMAATYPDLYAAAGIHSGLAYGSANDVISAFAAMRGEHPVGAARRAPPPDEPPRIIVLHGTADRTVAPSNANAIFAAAQAAVPGGTLLTDAAQTRNGRSYRRSRIVAQDVCAIELWLIDGAGHAWSGGNPAGSFADAHGPDAATALVQFFLKG